MGPQPGRAPAEQHSGRWPRLPFVELGEAVFHPGFLGSYDNVNTIAELGFAPIVPTPRRSTLPWMPMPGPARSYEEASEMMRRPACALRSPTPRPTAITTAGSSRSALLNHGLARRSGEARQWSHTTHMAALHSGPLRHAGGPCPDSQVLAADGLEEVHRELVDPLGGVDLHPVAGLSDPLDPHVRDPGAGPAGPVPDPGSGHAPPR